MWPSTGKRRLRSRSNLTAFIKNMTEHHTLHIHIFEISKSGVSKRFVPFGWHKPFWNIKIRSFKKVCVIRMATVIVHEGWENFLKRQAFLDQWITIFKIQIMNCYVQYWNQESKKLEDEYFSKIFTAIGKM